MAKKKWRGNKMMIDKVLSFADAGVSLGCAPPTPSAQRDRRHAAQDKRMRKLAKRAASIR